MAELVQEIDATSFAYLHIPADTGKPIVERRARMNTCLEDDVLREEMCALLTAAHGRATGTDTFVLTLPTVKSDHLAVSLYSDGDAVNRGLPKNARASGLCAACGFPSQQFHGDVFISRYFDDDVSGGEAWLRRDLTLAECSSDAAWVRAAAAENARRKGGSPSSLSAMLSSLQASGPGGGAPAAPPVRIDTMGGGGDGDGDGGAEHAAAGFTWTQTSDELEMRCPVPAATRPAHVSVRFAREKLRVAVAAAPADGGDAPAAAPLVDGALHAPAEVDGCAWSLEGAGDARLLVVTIEKLTPGTWPSLVKSDG